MSAINTAFPTVKNTMKLKKYAKLLGLIVAGMATPSACGFISEKDADELVSANGSLVEVNKEVKDASQNVAVRLTASGQAAQAAIAAEAATAAPAVAEPKQEFVIESGVPVPEINRGGRVGATKYPFEKLEIGQSFFVLATEKTPNPAKSLASTVNSANKRYKTTTPVRRFAIRASQDGQGKAGARVWRIEPKATPAA